MILSLFWFLFCVGKFFLPVFLLFFLILCYMLIVFKHRNKVAIRKKVNFSKTALITGGSRGSGFEYAKLFIEDEYNLVLVSKNEKKLLLAKEELQKLDKNCRIRIIASDLSELDGPDRVYDYVKKNNVEIHVLVNNAGICRHEDFVKTDYREFRNQIMVNAKAVVKLTHLILPGMIERKEGNILNMCSIASYSLSPFFTVYNATKSFLMTFSVGLALEMQVNHPYVTVTAVSPGPFDTQMIKDWGIRDLILTKWGIVPPPPSAKEIARIGYNAMLWGRVRVFDTFMNYALFGMLFQYLPDVVSLELSKLFSKK